MTRIRRCEECGKALSRYAAHCTMHPSVGTMAWSHRIRDAYAYVLKANGQLGKSGRDLDRWVEETDPAYYPGITRGDLALALSYARRWKLPPFDETDLPPVTTPAGLFG